MFTIKGTDLLKQLVRYEYRKEKYLDKEVKIVLSQPSVGYLSTVGIESFNIMHGSDLDQDKILIFPEKDIIEKYNNRDIPKDPIYTECFIGEKYKLIKKCPICESKIASTDKYCKQCGQRIKRKGE